MLLATAAMTIGVAGLAGLLGGRYAFNVGKAADRMAANVARGGFVYDRWPWWVATPLYWRVTGAFFVALGVALVVFMVTGVLAGTHLV